MKNVNSIIPRNNALLVFGALNANKEDRELSIKKLKPVQILIDEEIIPVSFFESWEVEGISAMAYHPNNPMVLYITKEGGLLKINLNKQNSQFYDISNLKDVHEITMIDNILWIANTGYNEAVAFDTIKEKVLKRVNLFEICKIKNNYHEIRDNSRILDIFHINQIFKGLDSNIYGLVHHYDGKQLLQKIYNHKIKKQGNGGVINLDSGERILLNLKSPHTVRIVNNKYWVFDSAGFKIKIFNKKWEYNNSIELKGYGRGADFHKKKKIFFAGISAIRNRYLKFLKKGTKNNLIQIINTDAKKIIDEINLNNIEQINNLYLIDKDISKKILEMNLS